MSWFADTLIFDERYVNQFFAKHQATKSTLYWNVGPRSFWEFLRTGSECMGGVNTTCECTIIDKE